MKQCWILYEQKRKNPPQKIYKKKINEGRGMRGKREEGQRKRDVRGRDEKEEVQRMNEIDDWFWIVCKCEK